LRYDAGMISRSLIASLLLVVGASPARAAPTVEQIGGDLGLDAAAIARVRQGALVQAFPKECSERDLAVGFVFMVKRPPADVAAIFRRGGDMPADPNVLATHGLAAAADLDGLRPAARSGDEAKRYLGARASDELNLGASELATLQKLGERATPADVDQALHKLLWARYQAYRARGLDGIEPYARADGHTRAGGDELRAVVTQVLPIVQKYAPAFADVLAHYPRGRPAGLEESFHWILYNLDNRPTPTLRHRMTLNVEGGLVAADRELYVGHGYNVMQAIGALLPVDGGTIVFYGAHTSTDQVGGRSSGLKHSIGRRVMAKQLEKIFEHFTK
jgi:hypothetical protein